MALFTESTYFLTLSVTACILLWGVSLLNGTVSALITASWNGNFDDGTPFNTKYTGIFLIDFPISLLVAFFFYGTNGSHPGYQLFLIDAYATLQSAFVWLYAESFRLNDKPFAVSNPIIWSLMWQAFGAAIALPLYFRLHLKWIDETRNRLSPMDTASARALPASFILGALLPAVIGMLPTWYPRADVLHQNILASWQPDPIWVSTIQALLVFVLSSKTRNDLKAVWWTQLSYLLATVSSASGHIYAISSLLASTDPAITFVKVYVPFLFTGPEGATQKLASGPWLFLQYDLIIISISCMSWAYLLTVRVLPENHWVHRLLPIIFLSSSVVLGPGATVSLALFWREGHLRSVRTKKLVTGKAQK
ncbi:conserved hypothetical protein [Talaromyces stipitatus ATCC 10500]|uniref:Uncharacterized protein n=1 Tax=Talaromyces stipitatus (strain ATCC 10500 / CBS 375.48 / QM 6759 / NRRL 1006) TaxID=441959 RepID=B8M7V2_TALSN|nr:uncharacterized protein TSTA_030960 [Talaromyces stipitatus ATCC 10500]EED19831.1 conserved hypothetical protein [Talaromyces stipitatus ATCC 10500]